MSIVTLTTDFGLRDPYVGQLKGAILSADPTAVIADCTHLIPTFDLIEAAYHLSHTWSHFPAGTVHLCTVNRLSAAEPEAYIGFRQNEHTFLCPDNGLAYLLFPDIDGGVFELETSGQASTKAVLSAAIRKLALGFDCRHLGPELTHPEQSIRAEPITTQHYIRGSIVHIDGYGNAVLNVHRDLVERMARGRRVHTRLANSKPIVDIVDHYHQVPEGDLLTRYNSMGYVEIAMNMGKVATLYGLERDQLVQLEFES